MIELVIKNLLKRHLKVKITHENPHAFFDGHIKVGIYWDNELINESIQKIQQSYF